jgi:hypothetical protein
MSWRRCTDVRRSGMQLLTHERMTEAIGFYLHMGFVEMKRLQLWGHLFIQMRRAVSPLSQ